MGTTYKRREDDLTVITKAKDLCNYILTVTDKSPKKFRFTLVTKLQNLALDVLESLFYANAVYVRSADDRRRIEERQNHQKEAHVKLKLLGYMALIAREQQCILPKQYEQISMQSAEVQRLLSAWAKSDLQRYKNQG